MALAMLHRTVKDGSAIERSFDWRMGTVYSCDQCKLFLPDAESISSSLDNNCQYKWSMKRANLGVYEF